MPANAIFADLPEALGAVIGCGMAWLKPERNVGAITREEAEAIAVRALAFIAQDADLLRRFIGVTGIEAGQMREAAREPGFLAGVLQFILAHEPTLTRFCEECAVSPASVAAALPALPFGDSAPDAG